MRRWVSALLVSPAANLSSLRAYLDALETDAQLRERRTERQRTRARVVRDYLVALDRCGTARIPKPESLAAALLTLIDATLRSAVTSGIRPEPSVVEGVCDVFERAIFSACAKR